jgi:hypothetical protein
MVRPNLHHPFPNLQWKLQLCFVSLRYIICFQVMYTCTYLFYCISIMFHALGPHQTNRHYVVFLPNCIQLVKKKLHLFCIDCFVFSSLFSVWMGFMCITNDIKHDAHCHSFCLSFGCIFIVWMTSFAVLYGDCRQKTRTAKTLHWDSGWTNKQWATFGMCASLFWKLFLCMDCLVLK